MLEEIKNIRTGDIQIKSFGKTIAIIFFVIAFFLSDADNKYTIINIIFLISTTIYVIYQINSGNPRLNEALLVENVLMQKAITIIHVISIFSLTFCFDSQIKRKKITS